MLQKIAGYVVNSYGLDDSTRDSRDHNEFRATQRSISIDVVKECIVKAMDDVIDNIYSEKPYTFVMIKSKSHKVSLVFKTWEMEIRGEMYPTIRATTYINGFSKNTLHMHETLVIWVD